MTLYSFAPPHHSSIASTWEDDRPFLNLLSGVIHIQNFSVGFSCSLNLQPLSLSSTQTVVMERSSFVFRFLYLPLSLLSLTCYLQFLAISSQTHHHFFFKTTRLLESTFFHGVLHSLRSTHYSQSWRLLKKAAFPSPIFFSVSFCRSHIFHLLGEFTALPPSPLIIQSLPS